MLHLNLSDVVQHRSVLRDEFTHKQINALEIWFMQTLEDLIKNKKLVTQSDNK